MRAVCQLVHHNEDGGGSAFIGLKNKHLNIIDKHKTFARKVRNLMDS